ncbi:MAG: flagellin [bacterium]
MSIMRVNTNLQARFAQNRLSSTIRDMQKTTRRLSSGKRINSAADDAAGLAISNKLHTTIRGLNQGRQNVQDGISMVQTAEGAYGEIQDKIGRLQELAVQAANDSLTDSDRKLLDLESRQIIDEINRMRDSVEFNGMKLLAGGRAETDADVWEDLDLWHEIEEAIENDKRSVDISASIVAPGTTTPAGEAGDINELDDKLTDVKADLKKAFQWWSNRLEAATGVKLNIDWKMETEDAPEMTGASTGEPLNQGPKNNYAEGNAGQFRFAVDEDIGAAVLVHEPGGSPQGLNDTLQMPGNILFNPNVAFGDDGDDSNFSLRWGATHAIGRTLGFPEVTDAEAPSTILDPTQWDADSDLEDHDGLIEEAALQEIYDTRELTLVGDGNGIATFHVGANRDEVIDVEFERVDAQTLGVWCVDLTTRERAENSIELIKKANERLGEKRANLGAMANRMDMATDFNHLQEEASQTSNSRIEDADIAEEAVQNTRAQVLAQAGTSVLTQATTQQELVLQLL